jgi:phosphoglycolate phosphatase-like HAD superfamily hydrolase
MTLDIPRIQALCFDVDGTLSDTDDLFAQRIARWLQPFRFLFPGGNPLPFSRQIVIGIESPGNFLFGIPDRLGLDDELFALGDLLARLGLGKQPRPFLLIPSVREMLSLLAARYPLSIVSVRGERSTRSFLSQFELEPFFQCIVTGQTCQHTKPYPDPILYAARQMGVGPQACLMIGDTTVDIRAGKAAGAQTVGVLCGFGEEAELRRAGADLILPTTAQVHEVLLAL